MSCDVCDSETMLCRLMAGSGVVGLGGMQLITHWATHPNLPIIRPLLHCNKVYTNYLSLTHSLSLPLSPSLLPLSPSLLPLSPSLLPLSPSLSLSPPSLSLSLPLSPSLSLSPPSSLLLSSCVKRKVWNGLKTHPISSQYRRETEYDQCWLDTHSSARVSPSWSLSVKRCVCHLNLG